MYSSDEEYATNYLSLSASFLDSENVDKENVLLGDYNGTSSNSQGNEPSSSQINRNSSRKRRMGTESFPSASCGLQPQTIPSSCTSSTGALKRVLEENTLSLAKLGRVVRQFDITVENEVIKYIYVLLKVMEILMWFKEMLTSKISDIKINMQHVKNMQTSVETLPSSSDSVVRALTSVVREQMNTIAGLSLTVNALLSKLREQDRELRRTNFHVAKNKEDTLPKGYSLQRKNISRVWHLESAPPFKVIWRLLSVYKEESIDFRR
ncbi:unnamed protein product [Cylicocyclus nassatus]|uniref:Uncharacterized protein n=1 Tax=Cylicocyclus nassatus TaxID=53992 RepID=A0AA36M1E3_CYLNA|nr:unnamed protein product [Cylicocyclus nassatus]